MKRWPAVLARQGLAAGAVASRALTRFAPRPGSSYRGVFDSANSIRRKHHHPMSEAHPTRPVANYHSKKDTLTVCGGVAWRERVLGPKIVGIAARLVHAVADGRAFGVAVLVEGLEIRDHAVLGLVAEPASDVDLPRRSFLALLLDRSRHARERRDLREEVDEDVGEALLLILLVDDLLPVLAQDRLARVREDSGVPPDLVRLGRERRVHLRELVVRDDSLEPFVGVLGEDAALREWALQRALDLLQRVAELLHAREGQEEPQNLVRALEDHVDAAVAERPAVRVLVHEAVAAGDLEAVVDVLPEHLGAEDLAAGALERVVADALVHEPGRQVDHRFQGVRGRRHARDLVADHLEVGDAGLELLALRRVADRELEHHLRSADRARAEGRAARVQRLHGDLEAVALFPDEVRGRDAAVLEDDLAGRRRAEPELLLFRSARKAGQRAVLVRNDGEARDLFVLVLLGRLGRDAREDREESREAAVGDPLLRAVQDVLVRGGVVDRGRPERARVRARFRFREAESRDHLSAREIGQPLLLLLVVSEEEKGLEADGLVGPDDDRRGGVERRDRLGHPAVRRRREAAAAVFLRNRHAEDAEISHGLHGFAREEVRGVDLLGVQMSRVELRVGVRERRHGLLHVLRDLRERKDEIFRDVALEKTLQEGFDLDGFGLRERFFFGG